MNLSTISSGMSISSSMGMKPSEPMAPAGGNIENRQPPSKPPMGGGEMGGMPKPPLQEQILNMSEDDQDTFFSAVESMTQEQKHEFGGMMMSMKDEISTMSTDEATETILNMLSEMTNSSSSSNIGNNSSLSMSSILLDTYA